MSPQFLSQFRIAAIFSTALPAVAANTRNAIVRFQMLVGPAIFAEAAIAGLLTTASKLRMQAVRMWAVFDFWSRLVITDDSQLD